MWKWLIVVLSIAGAVFALTTARKSIAAPPIPPLLKEPVRNPYAASIAGAGILEPSSENVVIGVTEPGLVDKVYVERGQRVKLGDPLYKVDTRGLEAERKAAEATLLAAKADADRVKSFRRKEEEPGLRARVEAAKAGIKEAEQATSESRAELREIEFAHTDFQDRYIRLEKTVKAAATPEDTLKRMQFQVEIARAKIDSQQVRIQTSIAKEATARAKLAQEEAELNIFLAGAWEPDVKKADAAVAQAQAQVERLVAEIERRTQRSPMNGVVVRCNLKEGEYALAGRGDADESALVIGSDGPLHVRVDIDEFDAPRFRPGLKAKAILKGFDDKRLELSYIRVEPFVIPKRALTNSQRETVDTRVLQAIYKVDSGNTSVYVGQQVDVYIETGEDLPAKPPENSEKPGDAKK